MRRTKLYEVGTQAGQLIILEHLENKQYLVKCLSCSNTKALTYNDLNGARHYNYGCGCRNRKPRQDAAIKNAHRRYKSYATQKDIEFKLSIEEFKVLSAKNCYYCGAEPSAITSNEQKTAEPLKYSPIDRTDKTKGFILENLRPCCRFCSAGKSSHTAEEFLGYLRGVVERSRNDRKG